LCCGGEDRFSIFTAAMVYALRVLLTRRKLLEVELRG
jgi:hypothetical protein